jgi:hypothetical protein
MNHPTIGSGFHVASNQWKVYIAPCEEESLTDQDDVIILGSGRTKQEAVEATVRELESAVQALKASVLN